MPCYNDIVNHTPQPDIPRLSYDIDGTIIEPEQRQRKVPYSERPLVPPEGGYRKKMLGCHVPHNQPLKKGKTLPSPNADLAYGRRYSTVVLDRGGDVVMEQAIWTTPEWTAYLAEKYDRVPLSSVLFFLPSIVITEAERTIMPLPKTTTPPRRNSAFDKDIPVFSNGGWSPPADIIRTPDQLQRQAPIDFEMHEEGAKKRREV